MSERRSDQAGKAHPWSGNIKLPPQEPPLRVVRKGLFTFKETSESVEQAEKENDKRHDRTRG
jgi:hypothetical protein